MVNLFFRCCSLERCVFHRPDRPIILKEIQTFCNLVCCTSLLQLFNCLYRLHLGKFTPCQFNRPIFVKHSISIFLSMKFHLNVVPAEKWLNILDTFIFYISLSVIITSEPVITSLNLIETLSTKYPLSSTKLTGKTPSLKSSQSPNIIKVIE